MARRLRRFLQQVAGKGVCVQGHSVPGWELAESLWAAHWGRLESQGLPWLVAVWTALCPTSFGLSEVKTSLGHF